MDGGNLWITPRENDLVVNIKGEFGSTVENRYLVKSKEWSKMKNIAKQKAQSINNVQYIATN